jgi:hypothetical protein
MPKLDPNATKLLRLVAQLTSPGLDGFLLRQQFNKLPINVMDAWGLPAEARNALTSMKWAQIGDYIKQELNDWGFPPGEFPEPDPECYIPASNLASAAYNMPDPQFKAVRPEVGPTGAAGFELTLYGEGLLLPLKVTFVPQTASTPVPPPFDASNAVFTAEGTFRCGRIKMKCTLPAAADKYEVKVEDVFSAILFPVPPVKAVYFDVQ